MRILNERIDIFKNLLHDISEAIVCIQSNMPKKAVNQLYELHGKLAILIKLEKRFNKLEKSYKIN